MPIKVAELSAELTLDTSAFDSSLAQAQARLAALKASSAVPMGGGGGGGGGGVGYGHAVAAGYTSSLLAGDTASQGVSRGIRSVFSSMPQTPELLKVFGPAFKQWQDTLKVDAVATKENTQALKMLGMSLKQFVPSSMRGAYGPLKSLMGGPAFGSGGVAGVATGLAGIGIAAYGGYKIGSAIYDLSPSSWNRVFQAASYGFSPTSSRLPYTAAGTTSDISRIGRSAWDRGSADSQMAYDLKQAHDRLLREQKSLEKKAKPLQEEIFERNVKIQTLQTLGLPGTSIANFFLQKSQEEARERLRGMGAGVEKARQALSEETGRNVEFVAQSFGNKRLSQTSSEGLWGAVQSAINDPSLRVLEAILETLRAMAGAGTLDASFTKKLEGVL